jgi:hypothetical protein
MSINTIRRVLYTLARFLGDVQAIRRGPKAILKRVVRKVVYRNVNKEIGKVLR